jgi:outer membrane immunogenic protein
MHRLIIIGVAACCGMSVAAQAADLGGPPSKDLPVAYQPGHSWEGFYVGGSAGLSRGDFIHTFTQIETTGQFSSTQIDKKEDEIDGAVYGAHIGYNWQFGKIAGINGTNLHSSTDVFSNGATADTDLDIYATAVARLGYAEDSRLFYGFGGFAWASIENSAKGVFHLDELVGSAEHLGWTVGAGVEYALNDRISLWAEYSHVDLGEETGWSTTATFGPTVTDSHKIDLDFDVVKVGVNYILSGGDHKVAPLK